MPLTLTAGYIMKQLIQLTIEQYNEHMRRGEGRLPVDVVENTPVREINAGTWFRSGGVVYLKTKLREIGVTLEGRSKFFCADNKGQIISNVEAALYVAYRNEVAT